MIVRAAQSDINEDLHAAVLKSVQSVDCFKCI